MRRRISMVLAMLALVSMLFAASSLPATAQDGALSPEELVEQERVRSTVEKAFQEYLTPSSDGDVRIARATSAAEQLLTLGVDAVPYLQNELEQERRDTYDFCAYVLGRLKIPEAAAVLHEAIKRAEAVDGDPPFIRKAWAGWALGLHGDAEVIDLLMQGRHRSGTYAIHGGMSVLEAVALQTAPESVPRLTALLEQYGEDEYFLPERRVVLGALRRVGDVRAIPKVAPLLDSPDRTIRVEAVNTLGAMQDPSSIEALLGGLDDEEFIVRRSIAIALEGLRADDRVKEILAHLETEDDGMTRGAFYRMLARNGSSRASKALRGNAGREDRSDRRYHMEALGMVEGNRGVELLKAGVLDPDNGASLAAIMTLGKMPGNKSREALLEAIPAVRPPVLQILADELGRLEETSAAPKIAERLTERALASKIVTPNAIVSVRKMGEALVRLRYHEALPGLKKALETQDNPTVLTYLRDLIARMELIRDLGDDRDRWIETTKHEDPQYRMIAYANLARLGGETSVNALIAAFDRTDESAERVEILRVAHKQATPPMLALIERVLIAPEFDEPHATKVRDMAAWNARLIGGDAMYALLDKAVRRRNARDVKVLVYAAALGGAEALPLLQDYRKLRMEYLGWQRGKEHDTLERIRRALASGWDIDRWDIHPGKLQIR